MSDKFPPLPPLPDDFAITRPSVRAIAEEHHLILRIVTQAGSNVHQVALDQQDRVLGFMSKLSEEDALLFSRLYAEEMDALNASQTEENERMMRENTAIAQSAAPAATGQLTTWVALAAFFAAVVALIKIMK